MMNKIKGMIYGALYGDALGSPYEFNKKQTPVDEIKLTKIKRFNKFTQNWRTSVLGQFSDDTEMALIILNHIIDNDMKYNKTEMIKNYMKWGNSKCPFMGKNTRALLQGITTVLGYEKRFVKRFPNDEEKQSAQSNGSLMRCYPFAIVGLFNPKYSSYIEQDCSITNPSDEVIKSIKIYIDAIIKALHGETKEDILANWKQPKEEPDITVNRGFYKHGIYCAFNALKNFNNYNDAIKYIISIGGDTDTNACIAGALLGAFYGIKKMKECDEFATNLEIMLSCDVSTGDFDRPIDYTSSKISSLIEKIKKYYDDNK